MNALRGIAVTAAAAALLGSGIPARALAGQTMESGESTSLLVRPELLSLDALAHRFPQAATLGVPRLRAMAGPSYTNAIPLVEANVGFGAARLFFGGQSFTTSVNPETLLQFGIAGTVGRVRAGAAVRGTVGNDGSTDRTTYDEDPPRELARSNGFWVNHLEFAVGLGVGSPDGNAFLDLVLETYRETFEIESDLVDSRNEVFGSGFTDADRVFRGSVAVRAGTPGPGRSALRYWAEFQDRSVEVTHERTLQIPPDDLMERFRLEDYGHRWATGISVVAPRGESRIHGFAFYENRVGPPDYRGYFSLDLFNREFSRSEEVWFGGAVERPLPGEVTLLAGLQGRFRVTKDETFRLAADLDTSFDRLTRETLDEFFSWGVRRSFQEIDLIGTMRTDLALSDLFFNLDVAIRL